MALRDRNTFSSEEIYKYINEYSPSQLFAALQNEKPHSLSLLFFDIAYKALKKEQSYKDFNFGWLKTNDNSEWRRRVDADAIAEAERVKNIRKHAYGVEGILDEAAREAVIIAESILNTMIINGKALGMMNFDDLRRAFNHRFTRSNVEFKQCMLFEDLMSRMKGKSESTLVRDVISAREADSSWRTLQNKRLKLA